MKTQSDLNKIFRLLTLTALVVGGGVAQQVVVHASEKQDHTVIVRSAQSVGEIVESELQSRQFARQIADYNGIATVGTLLPAGAVLQIPRPYMDAIEFGSIVFVKGDVTHTKTDIVVNPPNKGAAINTGDIIRTGSDGFVSLSFNSGARVNLQPDSEVRVKHIDCPNSAARCVISLDATKGMLSSEVTPRGKGEVPIQFSVDTPFLSAAVRGTAFYVDVERSVNRIGVTKGLVATDSGGSNFDLPKGQGLSASADAAPAQIDLLKAPQLLVDTGSWLMSSEDIIAWENLDGASSYEATIATDQDMSQTVAVHRSDEPVYQPELTTGEYHLTLAGIDAQNFVGLPVKRKLHYAEITDAEQPQLNIERREGVIEISMDAYDGPAQLLIGKSIDGTAYQVQSIDSMSDTIRLNLAEDESWVFRLRKVHGPLAVSVYSNYYVLSGAE